MARVFLCYAKEDKNKVDLVYEKLVKIGLNPWMDRPPSPYADRGIKPGLRWDDEIKKAISKADYFLAFLSQSSIAKRGYVQREYKLSLDQMNEIPPEQVYLIPTLLEDCIPPDIQVGSVSFGELQWYSLFEDGIDSLMAIILADYKRRGKYLGAVISTKMAFSTDHYQSGVTLLSYFATVLRQCLPDIETKVSTRQEAQSVTFTVECPAESKSVVENILKEYVEIATGTKNSGIYISDDRHLIQLQEMVKIATSQLDSIKAPLPSYFGKNFTDGLNKK